MEFRVKFQFNFFNLVLLVNILVFIFATLFQLLSPDFASGSSGRTLTQVFVLLGGMSLQSIFSGQFWTIITANFLHIEFIHFLLNMLALYTIGKKVVYTYGDKKFFIIYILGGIASMVLTIIVSLFLGIDIATLGASGSIFALCGVLISGSLKNRRYGIDLPFSIYDVLPIVVVSLIYGFLPGSGVNNWAHIGGLVAGLFLGLFFKHEMGEYKSKADHLIEKILYYFSTSVFTLSYVLLIITSILLILG
ncbi:MAG: rhomboid family intramembrane serine protease [Candidatus Dojkabacteria bacterium]